MLLTPLPLSQTVTPSRTPSPSSVKYFMDSPLPYKGRRLTLQRWKTYLAKVEDDVLVDLEEDDLNHRHDEKLESVDLTKNGTERYENSGRSKFSAYQTVLLPRQ